MVPGRCGGSIICRYRLTKAEVIAPIASLSEVRFPTPGANLCLGRKSKHYAKRYLKIPDDGDIPASMLMRRRQSAVNIGIRFKLYKFLYWLRIITRQTTLNWR